MNILHIAYLTESKCSGVNVVVPKYVKSQELNNNVALINITNIDVDVNNQISYNSDDVFSEVPFKIDIVVFHECYRIEFISIYKKLLKKNIPYIIIPHGELSIEAQKSKWLKKKIANFLIFNKFINNSIALQLLSDRESNATKLGKKHIVIPNGINTPNVLKNKFNTDIINFVYIGRLDIYHKGLDYMLEAFSMLEDNIKKRIRLSIYGPYDEKFNDILEKLVKQYELNDIVQIYGSLLGSDKQKVLLNSDVFIQTSRFEGMPMGILEALSYGLPVLITEGTTLNSIVDNYNCGWTSKTDAVEISKKIIQCIDETNNFSKMSLNAIDVVNSLFSWDKISNDTIKIYDELLKGRECLL